MALPLSDLVQALQILAPLELAESWDNVGLLVDPRAPGQETEVERVLLTIDATPGVLSEARTRKAQCLVAYHPPLFTPVKRVSSQNARVLLEAIAGGFAVYSPHTALDAVAGGINDWLAEAFSSAETNPIVPSPRVEPNAELKVVVFVPIEHADRLRDALAGIGLGVIGNYTHCSFNLEGEGTFFGREGADPAVGQAGRLERAKEVRLDMVCPQSALSRAARVIVENHPYEEPAWEVYPLAPKIEPGAGAGRLVRLQTPLDLEEVVAAVKRQIGVSHLRLAAHEKHDIGRERIEQIAICAGSGGALFERAPGVDLYLTGELRHHDVLRLVRDGASVLLCEHSNSERGYLPRLRDRLLAAIDGRAEVLIAAEDREPLRVV